MIEKNGLKMPEIMYDKVKQLQAQGAKVFLVEPELRDDDAAEIRRRSGSYCENCKGSGALTIQYYTGGPFPEPFQLQPQYGPDKKLISRGMVIDNGKYYIGRMIHYYCPVCHVVRNSDAKN